MATVESRMSCERRSVTLVLGSLIPVLLRERIVPRRPRVSGRSNSQADSSASRPTLVDGLTRFPALGYSCGDLAEAMATSLTFMPHSSCLTFPEGLTRVFMRGPQYPHQLPGVGFSPRLGKVGSCQLGL